MSFIIAIEWLRLVLSPLWARLMIHTTMHWPKRLTGFISLRSSLFKENWNGINDVELATLEWVDWFNKTRLHSTIGYMSPFEFEKRYYDNLTLSGVAA